MTYLTFGTPPPVCPKGLTNWDYPSTTVVTAVIAVVSYTVALLTIWKYNSVKVFETKIRTHTISNTWWIVYYMLVGTRYVFKCEKMFVH